MSETITATDANRRFAEMLREVDEGKTFVVTSHGRPIARIQPVRKSEAEWVAARKALLERLDRQKPTPIPAWTRAELYED